MSYNHYPQTLQEGSAQYLDTAFLPRVSPFGHDLVSVAEECEFQRRIDKRLTFNELRFFICQDFDHAVIDGETMLKQLWDGQFIRDADDLAFLVSYAVKALAEEGR